MRLNLTSVTSFLISILLIFATSSELNAAGEVDTEPLRDAVNLTNVRSHQAAFQAAADANGGNRGPGLPGFDDSSAYVVSQLEAAGYAVTVQPFSFKFFEEQLPAEFEQLAPNPETYLYFDVNGFAPMVFSGSGDVTALVQAVDIMIPPAPVPNTSTSGCEPADFTGFIPGNIALIQRGSCEFRTKAMNAEVAGATAVIIFNEGQPGRVQAFEGSLIDPSVNIPVIGASYAIGQDLYTTGMSSDVTVRIFVDAISENRTTQNVIAQVGGLQDRVVMAGAHLDSVLTGPGINDNGSGAAALLEIAVQMAALDIKPRNTVRFAWWGGEEAGLLGSHNYLSNLTIEAAKKITAYFDLEMIGSPNFVRFVFDGDGSLFPSAVPEGSAGIEKIINDYYAGLGLDVEAAEFEPHHSYTAFADAGIPVGGIFGGDDGIKTAAQVSIFGGSQGDQYDPCYHLACDTFDNVSLAYLDESSDAAAHTILTLAMTSTTQPKGRRTLPSCEEMGYDFSLKADPVYCRKSSSYWSKHPAGWPASSIMVGGVNYTKNQAIAVMKSKAKGDRTYALFNEQVAAKLNILACGQSSGAIDDTILAADAWLAANPPGSGVRSKDPEWDAGSILFGDLSAFNGGMFQSGSFSFDGLATVEILTDDGIYFDWTSTRSVDVVIVKGGRDANVYEYNPESFGDFDLHAPINRKTDEPYGLSYVEFCFDYDININVHKFHDVNNDGEWDDDEPEIGVDQFVLPDGSIGGSSGWPYLFTFPADGLTSSDVSRTPGAHQHSNDGIYTIEEFILPLWEQTALFVDGTPVTPLTNRVELPYAGIADESHDILFGNIGYAKIHGRKFEDLNANGSWESGEPAVADVVITLSGTDVDGNPVNASTSTDILGEFSFIDLAPGSYSVEETAWPAGGWLPSTPISSGPHVLAVGDDLDLGWVFGNYIPGSIHGHKFHDINGNGVEDDDEPRLAGTLFELVDADGNVLATEVSNNQGEYGFLGLVPGSYRVDEVPPAGWVQTTTHPGWLTIESRQEYVAEDGQAMLPDDSLKYEVLEPSLAFGNFERGSIHGYKFNDLNGDGVDDTGDPRLPGWVFELLDADGNVVALTTSDANGEFAFVDLGPDTYTVREVNQDGWVQTTPNSPPLTMVSGREYVALDGMANLPGGSTKHEYNVGSDLVFGNAQSGSIHGFKFNDTDGDGVRDPGEPGLEGWTIQLDADGDGVPDQITTTDVNGEFAFINLALGTYYLSELSQEGWLQTTTNPPPLTIQSGQEYVAEDGQARLPAGSTRYETNIGADLLFGNFQRGSIHGHKFHDLNGNGLEDPDEPRLAGWVFELNIDGVIAGTTTTDENGEYGFSGLGPAEYFVREVLPDGWVQITANPPQLKLLSGQEYVALPGQAQLPAGSTKYEEIESLLAFGNSEFQPVDVTACKYEDFDGDGDQDAPIPGWTVYLTIDGAVVDTQSTADDGCYTWGGLGPQPAGSYYGIAEVVPGGWTPISPTSIDFESPPQSGASYAGDFTNFQNVDVTACKYEDFDGDGDQDAPIPGWIVYLTIDGAVVDTQSTADDGCYTWGGLGPLPAGSYYGIEEGAGPPDLTAGSYYGIANGVSPDWTPTGPTSIDFESPPQSGASYAGNFTNFRNVDVTACKFEDFDGDGGQDASITGWTVYLMIDSAVVDTQSTGPDGCYTWENLGPLPAGSYYGLGEDNLPDWSPTSPATVDFESPPQSGASYRADFTNFRNEPPTAANQSYSAIGNVSISVPASAGLLVGATDPDGDGLTVNSVTGVTTGAIVIHNATTGSFTYTPPPGFEGTDSFSYDLIDNLPGGLTSNTATVEIIVNELIWFIDNSAGGAGDGRLGTPFNTLAAFEVVNGNGGGNDPEASDCIFIYSGSGNYLAPLTLENNQILIGQGASSSIATNCNSITLPSHSDPLPATGGTRPVLTSTSNAINLASGNTIRGLSIGDTTGTGLSGTSVGASTVNEVDITGTGTGVDITTGALVMSFDEISSSNAAGIDLSGVSGNFDVTMGTISSGSATAVSIVGSPIDLDVTLTSVSASGATNGISLDNTTGSFTINGAGGTCTSAGTCTGGSIIDTTGDGISLTNATNITLNQMFVDNTGRHGVFGTGVVNLAVNDSIFEDIGDADNEDAFSFKTESGSTDNNISGTLTLNNVDITRFHESGLHVYNETGTLVANVINGSSFNDNEDTPNLSYGVYFELEGNAGATLTVSDSTFDDVESDIVRFETASSVSNSVGILNNTSTDGGGPNNFPNGGGIQVITDGGDVVFDIQGNSLQDLPGDPIIIASIGGGGDVEGRVGGANASDGNEMWNDAASILGDGILLTGNDAAAVNQTWTVLIQNNFVGQNSAGSITTGMGDDGIGVLFGDNNGVYNITIEDNTIRSVAPQGEGIDFFVDEDGSDAFPVGNARIVDNDIISAGPGEQAIEIDTRETFDGCFHIDGNNNGSGGALTGIIELSQGDSSTLEITQASTAALSTANAGSTVITAGTVTFNGSCTSPTLPSLP